MRKQLLLIYLLSGLYVSAQPSAIKNWDIVKTFMGMDTANAQKIVKASGYQYQRSFENIGLKFSEFSRGYSAVKALDKEQVPDDIFLGSRNGIIDFIKLELIDQTYDDYNNALKRDGFVLDPASETDKKTWGREIWINSKLGIKVVGYRQRCSQYEKGVYGSTCQQYRLDALFVLRTSEKYCFPSPTEFEELYDDLTFKRSDVEDGFETYRFENRFNQFSCLPISMGTKEVANVVQMFWYFNYSRLKADFSGFNLSGSNILFYTVKTSFHYFLYTFYNRFKIDRNLLYYYQGKPITLIDYAEQELQRRKQEKPYDEGRVKDVEMSIDYIKGVLK